MKVEKSRESGSIIVYILIAIFLTGVLIFTATSGAKKSAQTQQLEEAGIAFDADIKTIENGITDCVLNHPDPDINGDGAVDATDGDNPPFPVYGDLFSGGTTGDAITDIRCPGANGQPVIFNDLDIGRSFHALRDTTLYTTTYVNDATEGVYVFIVRSSANALWDETISRLNDKFSTCKAAVSTTELGCANGCLFYWIKRPATSTIAVEAGCP